MSPIRPAVALVAALRLAVAALRLAVAALRLAVAVLLLAGAARAEDPARERPDPAPRATMHEVFEALTVLFPASLDERAFASPEARVGLQRAFDRLAASARELARHGEARDPAFRALARTLADDAAEASDRFASGHLEESRFGVHQLTQRCVECHSELPRARDFPLADRLLARVEPGSLDPVDRALLHVALRDFDAALSTWEALFADPAGSPARFDVEGTLADYLAVAIRAARTLPRAEAALGALRDRADAPLYLRTRLDVWRSSLRELGGAEGPPSLERARGWIERARSLSELPTSREGLVFDLAASSDLLRLVDRAAGVGPAGAPDPALAEAFYWLGVVEERTAWTWFVPRTELYMEAAVRAAPGGPFARRAFERVEEAALAELGGPDAAELPEATRRRLDTLRRLATGEPSP